MTLVNDVDKLEKIYQNIKDAKLTTYTDMYDIDQDHPYVRCLRKILAAPLLRSICRLPDKDRTQKVKLWENNYSII